MAQKQPKSQTGRPSVSQKRGQKTAQARTSRSTGARGGRSAKPASRTASARTAKASRTTAPQAGVSKRTAASHNSRSQASRSNGAAHGSSLGRVILSGGSSGGSTGGFHHAITIDEKTRNVKKQAGSKPQSSRSFFQRHRGVVIAVVVIALIACGIMIDGAVTQDHIYAGVRIGAVDVGGKTPDEAAAIIADSYGGVVAEAHAVIFPNADMAAAYETDGILSARDYEQRQSEIVAADDSGKLWIVDQETLGLSLPAEELSREAYAVGRENGGPFARASALFGGFEVPMRAAYQESAFETLVTSISNYPGSARREFSVEVDNGVANVVPGQDGYFIDRSALEDHLNDAIFHSDTAGIGILAVPEYGTITTSEAQAERLAVKINEALDRKFVFTYGDARIETTRAEVGSWVSVGVYDLATGAPGTGNVLRAQLDVEAADRSLAESVHPLIKDDYSVNFVRAGADIDVEISGGAPLPAIDQAVASLNDGIFDLSALPEGSESSEENETEYPATLEVPITSSAAPSRMSFDDALSSGLIVAVSTYTTEYLASNTNRVINIHIAADLIDDSITGPNEIWSFLELMGDPDADLGFVGAGAIMGNEHQDAVGGGICQVATTVFNAAYEAGYPIVRRINHSLYMANYPAGRDAAVAYPTLDLQWKNDTDSGVLLRSRYTDSSVTITLYGVDPGYEVKSDVGQWKEGKPYSSVTKADSSLAPGQRFVESYGSNGRIITVTRTVTDEDGNVKNTDVFYSEYQPVDQVTRVGG